MSEDSFINKTPLLQLQTFSGAQLIRNQVEEAWCDGDWDSPSKCGHQDKSIKSGLGKHQCLGKLFI